MSENDVDVYAQALLSLGSNDQWLFSPGLRWSGILATGKINYGFTVSPMEWDIANPHSRNAFGSFIIKRPTISFLKETPFKTGAISLLHHVC